MKVCIKGAAEDVKIGDIQDVCLDFDRILLATDGSSPRSSRRSTRSPWPRRSARASRRSTSTTAWRRSQLPEEIECDDAWEGYHPSIKGLGIAKIMAERNGVPVEIEVIQGGVAKRIIKTAEEYGADMIVLGETGRTGLKRLGMGSIAETVVRGAPRRPSSSSSRRPQPRKGGAKWEKESLHRKAS